MIMIQINDTNNNYKNEKNIIEKNINKEKKKNKEIFKKFENLIDLKEAKYEIDINFYNISLFLILLLIAINYKKFKKYLPKIEFQKK